jgi:23S rRNA (cytosine1962-C5)-methyltransferase
VNFSKVEVTSRGASQIKAGSLWIFANEFVTKLKELKSGEWVNFEKRGEFVGFGYVNPHSLIAGRICSREPVTERKELIQKLIKESLIKRSSLKDYGSFRGVFSESDSLPGLIVDIYGANVVAQFNTLGMDDAKDDVIASLENLISPEGLVLKADSSVRQLEGAKSYVEVVIGDKDKLKKGQVREDDVLFAADFVDGQKTGFFLDQRENRRHLKKMANEKTVLDLCSYSGGWGLTALKGGAKSVTFIDQSEEALKLAKLGLELNSFDSAKAKFICSDIFDYLVASKERYDIVICDPPAFVKSKKNLPQAVKAYKKLNNLALRRVNEGGLMYSCSCSFHFSEIEFEETLKTVAQESGILVQIVYRGGQGLDHPWILNRPESRYLKCYCLQVLSR